MTVGDLAYDEHRGYPPPWPVRVRTVSVLKPTRDQTEALRVAHRLADELGCTVAAAIATIRERER